MDRENAEVRSVIDFDVRAIGRHMSRERYQRGSLKKIGKTRRMWRARWHVWVKQPDGSERRRPRKQILGPVAEMTRGQAQEKLDALIKADTGQVGCKALADPTFADVWKRYAELKAATWSTTTSQTVRSVFSGDKAKRPSVLALIGARKVRELTRDPLQDLLNTMALRGDSYSKVKKARTYLAAALEYARDERLLDLNPARRLEMPTKLLAKPCERFYSLDEVRALLSKSHGREHLVLRIFVNCGLRPGELFALREDDIEPGRLRIDEAVKEKECGADRIGDTKTAGSRGYVGISAGLEEELRIWIHARRQQQPYHIEASAAASDLLFASERGTPFRLGNYLKRYLKPLAKKAGISDMTFAALRRTCATHFHVEGGPKATQSQLRHTTLAMTGLYIKQIPEEVRAAVESMDRKLCSGTESEGLVQ
jgi:integrase